MGACSSTDSPDTGSDTDSTADAEGDLPVDGPTGDSLETDADQSEDDVVDALPDESGDIVDDTADSDRNQPDESADSDGTNTDTGPLVIQLVGAGYPQVLIALDEDGSARRLDPELGGIQGVSAYSVSHGGEWVALVTDSEGGARQLFTVSPRSEADPSLLDEGNILQPTLSPDGEWIAYGVFEDSTADLIIKQTASGEVAATIEAIAQLGGIQWSPDSTTVAFVDAENQTLHVLEPDTASAPTEASNVLSDQRLNQIQEWSWSPDSAHLAVKAAGGESNTISVMVGAAVEGGLRTLTQNSDFSYSNHRFAWSPDGSSLAFTMREAEGISVDLYTAPADGSSRVNVTETQVVGAEVTSFGWHPNSRTLAYFGSTVSFELSELITVDKNGDDRDVVVEELTDASQIHFAPNGNAITHFDIDGSLERHLSTIDLLDGTPTSTRLTPESAGAIRHVEWVDNRGTGYTTDNGAIGWSSRGGTTVSLGSSKCDDEQATRTVVHVATCPTGTTRAQLVQVYKTIAAPFIRASAGTVTIEPDDDEEPEYVDYYSCLAEPFADLSDDPPITNGVEPSDSVTCE